MGCADVGADVYIVLGMIAYWANAAAPMAFAIASITCITTGLCYTELASAYPVAGGAHFFSLKAFGDFHGFVAGWALMLDYTIDIALFSLASVGYLGFFLPAIRSNQASGVAAAVLVLLLVLFPGRGTLSYTVADCVFLIAEAIGRFFHHCMVSWA